MRLLHHGLKVAAVTGDREPHDREHELQVSAAVQQPSDSAACVAIARWRSASSGDPRSSSYAALSALNSASVPHSAQREAGKELMGRGPLTAQDEAEPVVRQQATSEGPLLRRLRVADRLNRVPVFRKPLAGRAVQRGQFVRCGPPSSSCSRSANRG